MEERSIKVLDANTTFFSKISTKISKILVPTKLGINSMIIAMKRNNVLKSYMAFQKINEISDENKKKSIEHKYEESYSLYLESLDKNIMDSIYSKVKKGLATDFEKTALSKYYEITVLKDKEYNEYKSRKQKYLLEIDFESLRLQGVKSKSFEKYINFYLPKMDSLYKSILKNYSIRLTDNIKENNDTKNQIYKKIFMLLEEYAKEIMPLKVEYEEEKCKDIMEDYEVIEGFNIGKPDEINYIKEYMIYLAFSRKIFTHSLPLTVAEDCYIYLLKEIRNIIQNETYKNKLDKEYKMLIDIIEEYNNKLLSTKIYWDKPEEKASYKVFWDKVTKAKTNKEKEVIYIKEDLKKLNKSKNNYAKIIKLHKERLVKLGAMKELKNNSKTLSGRFVKVC